jgi:hypothetical protein
LSAQEGPGYPRPFFCHAGYCGTLGRACIDDNATREPSRAQRVISGNLSSSDNNVFPAWHRAYASSHWIRASFFPNIRTPSGGMALAAFFFCQSCRGKTGNRATTVSQARYGCIHCRGASGRKRESCRGRGPSEGKVGLLSSFAAALIRNRVLVCRIQIA